MDNYRAIRAVQAYIDDFMFEPTANWPPYQFKKRSYEIYAANKILSLIAASNGVPARTVIDNFILLLHMRSDGKETDMFFHIMEDVATDINDILSAME